LLARSLLPLALEAAAALADDPNNAQKRERYEQVRCERA
jgi:hypothetical protein